MLIFEGLGGISILLCYFITDKYIIIFLIMLFAFFYAIAAPSAQYLFVESSTRKNRDAVMSLEYFSFNLGAAFGPIFAGILFNSAPGYIFILNGIACILGVVVVAFLFDNTNLNNIANDKTMRLSDNAKISLFEILKRHKSIIFFQ